MKRILLLTVLFVVVSSLLSVASQTYTVNFRVYNPYGANLVIILTYNATVSIIDGNTSLNLPNVSTTLRVYIAQLGYDVLINGEKTNEFTFIPSEIHTVNINIKPEYAYINISLNGTGRILVKFNNGTQIVTNKTTMLKVPEGSFLTLTAQPINDAFLGWTNSSTFTTLWIVAQNSTIIANFGHVKDPKPIQTQSQELIGLAFLLIIGGFYFFIRRKKNI